MNRDLKNRKYIIISLVLFGLIFVRYCYFGFQYFYQLDDYIQYHNYTAYGGGAGELIKSLGLLSSRPLAGLFDLFVWSPMYSVMLLAVAIISAMYSAAAVLFHKVFSKHFGTGFLFFVVFALLPLGFEGTYWLSASSRIVVGLFFAALSLLFFDKWCSGGRKRNLVLFVVFQFVCFCFYEQVLAFSCAATLVLMVIYFKKERKRALWGFLMLAGIVLYFVVTKLAPGGVYSDRTAFFMPWKDGYFSDLFLPLSGQVADAAWGSFAGICGKGLLRGFGLLVKQPNVLWCIVVVVLCSGFFILARNHRRKEFHFLPELFAGLLLMIAPIALFYVIASPWFGIRNLVTSFCGLALICDALLDLLFCRLKKGHMAESVIASVLVLLCCVASVSELHDYRETTLADTQIATEAYSAFSQAQVDDDEQIWLLNVSSHYLDDWNYQFHEHVFGCTSSKWAMTGSIRAINDKYIPNNFDPIPADEATFSDGRNPDEATAFLYAGGGFVPVGMVPDGEGRWTLRLPDGSEAGELVINSGALEIILKE